MPGRAFRLNTIPLKQEMNRQNQEIEAIRDGILAGEITEAKCPICGADLHIVNAPRIFDLTCTQRCFNYNFHKEPRTGKFLHGHFFRS